MSLLDIRVPAVLLRIDRNPFHHGTLGAARSLGRSGVEVHVVADSAESPVGASRYVRQMHPPPLPGASPDDVLAVLRRVADGIARPAVLVPLDDASAIAVSRMRDELAPSYLLPSMPGGLAERVADKAELAAVCTSTDVPHPTTLIPDSPAEVADAMRRLGLPVVAKWSRPWLLPAGSGLRSTVLVRSVQQARELFLRTEEAGSRLLLQAYLSPGPDRDWFFHGYADHSGTVRAGGPGRKQLAWPRGAGLTAVGCWTPNTQVQALAERLTGELGYRGIFDLDFRRCGATGRYHLLDFNPRAGAQFRLFADSAGLDVVRAMHLDLTGRPLPDGLPMPGRAFVVENYAPLAALRAAPGGRELAWYAADDRSPGRVMWAQWCRHVSRRLRERLGTTTAAPTPRLIPRAASPSLTDNEKASS
ncbi:ATP-grasp domain-containing protein [Streptomyces coeruleorubidus]|uniref:ATP-grasp domain-containing protein n=1 Tax=Streptomyces coeruleorubidus TaxID=116188 RepID=A0A5J6I0C1_STRC4|nr:ATP-grasp domain-containing protein [Streptomyces coeruleorubidus]QEV25478.1 ATP-grasp domain-containing protein [Streptomyces coeruleorubidus]GGT50409.1 ATP-grasp domain-containing protein [Streptomyces coeruleorubidus]